MVKTPIYFDHAATTPVDKRVLDKMLPYFTEVFDLCLLLFILFSCTFAKKVVLLQVEYYIAEICGIEKE